MPASPLSTTFERAVTMDAWLQGCFRALEAGQFGYGALRALSARTLAANGVDPAAPVASQLAALEPVHTGLIVSEAQLLTQSAGDAQRQIRLLLRSSRAILCPPDDTGDAAYALVAGDAAQGIQSLHERYVPYAYQTAENFLTAARSYPSAPRFEGDMAAIEAARDGIAGEFQKLHDGMRAGPMDAAALDAFYADYTDMSDRPRADYAASLAQMAEGHIAIANTHMARQGLRITQAYACLTDADTLRVINIDTVAGHDFAVKFTETRQSFARNAFHLEGGDLAGGPVMGARGFLDRAARYTPEVFGNVRIL